MRFGCVTSSFERTKPPPSKWFVAPGPDRKNSHLNPTHGRFRHFIAGATETGCGRGVLHVDLEVVLQVLALRQVVDDVDAERAQLVAVPDPESWRSCGELIAPPQRITSPARTTSVAPGARPRRRSRGTRRTGRG